MVVNEVTESNRGVSRESPWAYSPQGVWERVYDMLFARVCHQVVGSGALRRRRLSHAPWLTCGKMRTSVTAEVLATLQPKPGLNQRRLETAYRD